MKKTGIELIAKERREQIEKHGFTAEHDKQNSKGEMIDAALFLLSGEEDYFPATWDERWMYKFKAAIKQQSFKSFIVAGALIAAEIDRLQAVEEKYNKRETI